MKYRDVLPGVVEAAIGITCPVIRLSYFFLHMADRTENTPIDHEAKDSSQARGHDEAAKSDEIPA